MKSLLKYRTLPFSLAAIFAVFNIGVPVVLASCPMPKNARAVTCSACFEEVDGNTLRLTNERNTSCCLTIIAADRNTTAFVQLKKLSEESHSLVPVQYSSGVVCPTDLQGQISRVEVTASPPSQHDIPIFTSSLLI